MSVSAGKRVEPFRYSIAVAAIAGVHFVLAHYSPQWTVGQAHMLGFWPPSGVSLAVLLILGLRYWPAIFLGALAANLATDASIASAVGVAVGNTLEAIVGVVLLGLSGFNRRLTRVTDALRLIVWGGIVAPVVGAANGAAQICLSGHAPWSEYAAIGIAWWLADGLRIIVVTPFLLIWLVKPSGWPSRRTLAEAICVAAVIAGTIGLAFRDFGDSVTHPALTYAAFPAVLFATFRFGLRGATASALLTALLAVAVRTQIPDLFVPGSLGDGLAVLQVFTGSLVVSSLVLAAALAEREDAVSALRRSEAEASQARTLLIDAIESLDDGFVLWDARDRLVLFNRTMAEMLSERGNFLVPGMTFTDLITKGVRSGDILEATGREDAYIRERIAHHRNADGESIEQHVSEQQWARIRERRTREGGVVMIRTDITTSKRRERELIAARSEAIEASRTKSEFLAMMSHELRTPLNVIIGFAEILRNQGSRVDPKKAMEYADDIYEAGRHLLNLLNDLLDLSKAEAGKMELQLGPVDVADVVERSLRMIRERATHARVALINRIEPDLPIVEADERKLIQILLNLLSNAVKFTPEMGEVVIAAWRDGPHELAIRVADTGIGIAPENIEKALTAFGQVHNLLTREQTGTGLGLPLAKRLAELHGGTLDLQSVVGAGTTVTLRFPVGRTSTSAVA